MSVTVTVQNTDHKFQKTEWDQFPDSVITSMLKHDPDLTTIELTHSCITNPILILLRDIIDQKITTIPRDQPLQEASRYLGISLLALLGNPKYDEIQAQFPHWSVHDKHPQDYKELMSIGITSGYDELVQRLCHDNRSNSFLLQRAVDHSNVFATRLLLSYTDPTKCVSYVFIPGVDKFPTLDLIALSIKRECDQIALLLLSHPYVDLIVNKEALTGGQFLLLYALERGRSTVVTYLLTRNVDIGPILWKFLYQSLQILIEFVPIGLAHPELKSTDLDRLIEANFDVFRGLLQPTLLDMVARHDLVSQEATNTIRLYRAVIGQDRKRVADLLSGSLLAGQGIWDHLVCTAAKNHDSAMFTLLYRKMQDRAIPIYHWDQIVKDFQYGAPHFVSYIEALPEYQEAMFPTYWPDD